MTFVEENKGVRTSGRASQRPLSYRQPIIILTGIELALTSTFRKVDTVLSRIEAAKSE